jgi:DNA polymerase IV
MQHTGGDVIMRNHNQDEILLCDLDAFFAAVEQLDNPELRGKPVLVGGDPAGRGVVSTCSYEARKFGVRSAMPMKKALELCPQAVRIRGNMRRYQEMSARVRQILERYTPDIEPVSIDEAYLAVKKGTGLATARAIRAAVKEELGLTVSIGVSVNKLLAKIACELAKPDNLQAIWPRDVPQQLWPLPVKVLPGVGPVTEKKLGAYGIRTVGDLAAFPEKSLVRLLGKSGIFLQAYARGEDSRKLETEHERKSISEETTFPRDVFDPERVLVTLLELAGDVGYRLRTKGLRAKTISLKLRFADFKTITRDLTLAESTDSDREIYRCIEKLFLRHSGRPPWRLVGVRASTLERSQQLSLYPPAADGERELDRIKDRLRQKYGREVLVSARRLRKDP